jgi:hypothetical protein
MRRSTRRGRRRDRGPTDRRRDPPSPLRRAASHRTHCNGTGQASHRSRIACQTRGGNLRSRAWPNNSRAPRETRLRHPGPSLSRTGSRRPRESGQRRRNPTDRGPRPAPRRPRGPLHATRHGESGESGSTPSGSASNRTQGLAGSNNSTHRLRDALEESAAFPALVTGRRRMRCASIVALNCATHAINEPIHLPAGREAVTQGRLASQVERLLRRASETYVTRSVTKQSAPDTSTRRHACPGSH